MLFEYLPSAGLSANLFNADFYYLNYHWNLEDTFEFVYGQRERAGERSPAAAVTLYRGKFNCYETRETLCWSLRIITKHLGYHYVSSEIKDILFRDSGQMYLCIHSSPFMGVQWVLMTHNDLYLSQLPTFLCCNEEHWPFSLCSPSLPPPPPQSMNHNLTVLSRRGDRDTTIDKWICLFNYLSLFNYLTWCSILASGFLSSFIACARLH